MVQNQVSLSCVHTHGQESYYMYMYIYQYYNTCTVYAKFLLHMSKPYNIFLVLLCRCMKQYQPSFPLDSSSGVSSSAMSHPAVSMKISGVHVRGVNSTPARSLQSKNYFYNIILWGQG